MTSKQRNSSFFFFFSFPFLSSVLSSSAECAFIDTELRHALAAGASNVGDEAPRECLRFSDKPTGSFKVLLYRCSGFDDVLSETYDARARSRLMRIRTPLHDQLPWRVIMARR